jgi:hypothetical protein
VFCLKDSANWPPLGGILQLAVFASITFANVCTSLLSDAVQTQIKQSPVRSGSRSHAQKVHARTKGDVCVLIRDPG